MVDISVEFIVGELQFIYLRSLCCQPRKVLKAGETVQRNLTFWADAEKGMTGRMAHVALNDIKERGREIDGWPSYGAGSVD